MDSEGATTSAAGFPKLPLMAFRISSSKCQAVKIRTNNKFECLLDTLRIGYDYDGQVNSCNGV